MSDEFIKMIETRFHELMRSRVRDLGGELPSDMPHLMFEELSGGNHRWLAIDGMYGGFKFRFEGTATDPRLVVDSWSRVVGYSGMTHVITPTEVTVTQEGFG